MPSEISVAARKDAHLDLAKKAVPSDVPYPAGLKGMATKSKENSKRFI